MKTICSLVVCAALGFAVSGCGSMSGSIGLGKYGDITSGTYNLDLSPVIEEYMPGPKSYNEDPTLEK